MKPTIGRVVIYNTTKEEQEKMRSATNPGCNVHEKLPATVVAVWTEETVNLQVLLDGKINGESTIWKTSASKGDGEGQWNWPVIEK